MRRTSAVVPLLLLAGCTSEPPDPLVPAPASVAPSSSARPVVPAPEPAPVRYESARVMRHVRVLAGRIGPRLATGPAYARAADYVARQFRLAGYLVERQPVDVPAGSSWGVPVPAGRSWNLVATRPGFDPARPHRLVGAHLDTVAVAPGAEDNASGVAVLLELARLSATDVALPTVFVAFGAEEPVGSGELHHFGSTEYVARMPEGSDLRAMVSLDRVGVGSTVPLSSVAGTSPRVRDALAATADRLDVAYLTEEDSASDHESFADAGIPAGRVGSTPYAGYHSADDVVGVVAPAQLRRVARVVRAWLRP